MAGAAVGTAAASAGSKGNSDKSENKTGEAENKDPNATATGGLKSTKKYHAPKTNPEDEEEFEVMPDGKKKYKKIGGIPISEEEFLRRTGFTRDEYVQLPRKWKKSIITKLRKELEKEGIL